MARLRGEVTIFLLFLLGLGLSVEEGGLGKRQAFYKGVRNRQLAAGDDEGAVVDGEVILEAQENDEGDRHLQSSIAAAAAVAGPVFAQCDVSPGSGFSTIFKPEDRPAFPGSSRGGSIVIGTRFTITTAGFVTGFRWLKPANEYSLTGRTAYLYSWPDGKQLASLFFSDTRCTSGGWISGSFARAFQVTVGATYVIAIDASTYYASSFSFFYDYAYGYSNGVSAGSGSGSGGAVGGPNGVSTANSNSQANAFSSGGVSNANANTNSNGQTSGPGGVSNVNTNSNSNTNTIGNGQAIAGSIGVAGPGGVLGASAVKVSAGNAAAGAIAGNAVTANNVGVFSAAGAQAGGVGAIAGGGGAGGAGTLTGLNSLGYDSSSSTSGSLAVSGPNGALGAAGGQAVSGGAGAASGALAAVGSNDYYGDNSKGYGDDSSGSSYGYSYTYSSQYSYFSKFGGVYSLGAGIFPNNNDMDDTNFFVDIEFFPGTSTPPSPAPVPPPPPPPTPTPAPPTYKSPKCRAWPTAPYQTIFNGVDRPATNNNQDGCKLVLGTRFTVSSAGVISGFRFFRGLQEPGVQRRGILYSWPEGRVLTAISFNDQACSGDGWVSIDFDSSFQVTLGSTYVIAVDSVSYYPKDAYYFPPSRKFGDLTALGSVYAVNAGNFPSNTNLEASNYWVDVEFYPGPSAPTPYPVAPTPYPLSNSNFGTTSSQQCQCGAWPSAGYQTGFMRSDLPATFDNTDGRALVLGTRFSVASAGLLTGFRFFKGIGEATSSRTGFLYSWPDGRVLSQVTFTDSYCQSKQWVSISFPTPFRASIGTTYLVAVDSVLYYPKTANFFRGPRTLGDLTVIGSTYGLMPGAFPSYTDLGPSSYFVDIEYQPPGPTQPSAPIPVPPAASCSCGAWPASPYQTLFNAGDRIGTDNNFDGAPLVLGTRFQVVSGGIVTGFRYFKSVSEPGIARRGILYSWPDGRVLTSVRFSDDKCKSGWVSVAFDAAFQPSISSTFVVAVDYLTYYPKNYNFFPPNRAVGGLVAISSVYGLTVGGFPGYTDLGVNNYWIDIEFYPTQPSPPPPTPSPSPASYSPPATPIPQTPKPVTLNPPPTLVARCGYWPSSPFLSVFGASDLPSTNNFFDGRTIVVGTRFSVASAGVISAVRLFKGLGELTVGRRGFLYSWPDGALLTSVFFGDSHCTTAGWVSAAFDFAFAAVAGASYVIAVDGVSVYARSLNFFTNARRNGDITAFGSVYTYASGGFPSLTDLSSTNYYVDIEYRPSGAPLPVPGVSNGYGASAYAKCGAWPPAPYVTLYGVKDIPLYDSYTYQYGYSYAYAYGYDNSATGGGSGAGAGAGAGGGSSGGGTANTNSVTTATSPAHSPGSSGYNSGGSGYAYGYTYQYGYSAWAPFFTPYSGSSFVIGTRFVTLTAGLITGIRFFKTNNDYANGRWGHLYSWPDGKRLTSIYFADTTCSQGGWVSVSFSQGFRASVGGTYVVAIDAVSYLSLTPKFFPPTRSYGELYAASSVYGLGKGIFPSLISEQSSCYFVDVEYQPVGVVSSGVSGRALTERSLGLAGPTCSSWPSSPSTTSIFTSDDTPKDTTPTNDGMRRVLGLRFNTTTDGTISAIRYFKAAGESQASHTANIFTASDGQLVATTGAFEDACSGSEWVSVLLTRPFAATASEEYILSLDYVTSYIKTDGYFTAPKTSGGVTALGSTYTVGFGINAMPSFNETATTNYWLDGEKWGSSKSMIIAIT